MSHIINEMMDDHELEEIHDFFKDTEESNATVHYYSTLFHELTHSTGHESRTNRIKTFRYR
jgi:antirestriction protein ArdC